jgi:hypothetical protein
VELVPSWAESRRFGDTGFRAHWAARYRVSGLPTICCKRVFDCCHSCSQLATEDNSPGPSPQKTATLDGSGRSAQAYGSRGRARCVPDQVVGRGSSRLLADRLIGLPTWVAARGARVRGILIRKRSVVQVHVAPPRS